MFGLLIGLISPGSILADRKYFIPVFVTVSGFQKNTNSVFFFKIHFFCNRFQKTGILSIFYIVALIHINCYCEHKFRFSDQFKFSGINFGWFKMLYSCFCNRFLVFKKTRIPFFFKIHLSTSIDRIPIFWKRFR